MSRFIFHRTTELWFPSASHVCTLVTNVEDTPIPSSIHWNQKRLSVQLLEEAEAGRVHVMVRGPRGGCLLLPTVWLFPKRNGFCLELEILRGTISRIRSAFQIWESNQLPITQELKDEATVLTHEFIRLMRCPDFAPIAASSLEILHRGLAVLESLAATLVQTQGRACFQPGSTQGPRGHDPTLGQTQAAAGAVAEPEVAAEPVGHPPVDSTPVEQTSGAAEAVEATTFHLGLRLNLAAEADRSLLLPEVPNAQAVGALAVGALAAGALAAGALAVGALAAEASDAEAGPSDQDIIPTRGGSGDLFASLLQRNRLGWIQLGFDWKDWLIGDTDSTSVPNSLARRPHLSTPAKSTRSVKANNSHSENAELADRPAAEVSSGSGSVSQRSLEKRSKPGGQTQSSVPPLSAESMGTREAELRRACDELRSTQRRLMLGPLLRIQENCVPQGVSVGTDGMALATSFGKAITRQISSVAADVDLIHVVSGINGIGVSGLTPTIQATLVAEALETAATAAPYTPLMISFVQPLGERLAWSVGGQSSDQLLIKLAKQRITVHTIGLELDLGYFPNGTLPRDAFHWVLQLQQWSVWDVPIYIFLRVPSQSRPESKVQHFDPGGVWPLTPLTQRDSVQQFVNLASALPWIHGVIFSDWQDQPQRFLDSGLTDAQGEAKPLLDLLLA